MTRNIYVLGIDHEIQTFCGKRTQEEKDKFKNLLEMLVREHSIQFVGEECNPDKCTIAKCLASSSNIQWQPIEMSREAREALGIAEEQRNHRQTFDDITCIPSPQKRVLSDGIREEYMVWRTLTKAGDVQNILVLCGSLHAEELYNKFKKHSRNVTVVSLSKCPWYTHPDCD